MFFDSIAYFRAQKIMNLFINQFLRVKNDKYSVENMKPWMIMNDTMFSFGTAVIEAGLQNVWVT